MSKYNIRTDSHGFLVGRGGRDVLQNIADDTSETLNIVKSGRVLSGKAAKVHTVGQSKSGQKKAGSVRLQVDNTAVIDNVVTKVIKEQKKAISGDAKERDKQTDRIVEAVVKEKVSKARKRGANGRFMSDSESVQSSRNTARYQQKTINNSVVQTALLRKIDKSLKGGRGGGGNGGGFLSGIAKAAGLGMLGRMAGGGAGMLGKIGRFGMKSRFAPLMLLGGLMAGVGIESSIMSRGEKNKAHFKNGMGILGGMGGAAAGAAIGQALIPIPVVGAIVGGLAGSFMGGQLGEWAANQVDKRLDPKLSQKMFSSWKGFTSTVSGQASNFWRNNAPKSWQNMSDSIAAYSKSVFDSFSGYMKEKWDAFTNNKVVKAVSEKTSAAVANTKMAASTLLGKEATVVGGLSATAAQTKKLEDELYKSHSIKSRENTAGGLAHAGTYALAQDAKSVFGSDFKYYSSFKDAYHAKNSPRSTHNKGLAFDMANKSGSKEAGYRQAVALYEKLTSQGFNGMLLTKRNGKKQTIGNGTDFTIIDEYNLPSAKASGGHLHFNWGNIKGKHGAEAADKYYRATRGGGVVSGYSTVVGRAGDYFGDLFARKGKQKTRNKILDATLNDANRAKRADGFLRGFNGGETITGLNAEQTAALAAMVAGTESGFNYQNRKNPFGFAGAYQMGAQALEQIGYLKKGTTKRGAPDAVNNAYMRNPNNWTSKVKGGLEEFYNNPRLQDEAYVKYTNANIAALRLKGVSDSAIGIGNLEQTAFATKAAHLKGAGGAAKLLKRGIDSRDGFGTSARQYGLDARQASPIFYSAALKVRGASSAGTPKAIKAIEIKAQPQQMRGAKGGNGAGGNVSGSGQVRQVAHLGATGRTVSNNQVAHIASGGIIRNQQQ